MCLGKRRPPLRQQMQRLDIDGDGCGVALPGADQAISEIAQTARNPVERRIAERTGYSDDLVGKAQDLVKVEFGEFGAARPVDNALDGSNGLCDCAFAVAAHRLDALERTFDGFT